MAKKSNRVQPVRNVTPGADPYQKNNSGRNLGKMMGAVCLLVFIVFEQLWIGILACAIAFAVIWGIQVFLEKSKTLFTSVYLYAAIGTAILACAEYSNGFVSNLLKIG